MTDKSLYSIAAENTIKRLQTENERMRNLVVGWREYDWPEGFDRYTAQLIADRLEKED